MLNIEGEPEQMTTNSSPPQTPPPEIPGLKPSSNISKLRAAASDYFFRPPSPSKGVDLFAAHTGPYFFYGTLADPSMVRDILELETEPELRPARIVGYKCKLWGQYPALLDSRGSVVEGAVYHVETVNMARGLRHMKQIITKLILVASVILMERSPRKVSGIPSNSGGSEGFE